MVTQLTTLVNVWSLSCNYDIIHVVTPVTNQLNVNQFKVNVRYLARYNLGT